MPDLLIPLYGENGEGVAACTAPAEGVSVRRALAHERSPVLTWVEESFSVGWAGEASVALGSRPATCFLAVVDGELAGFCCFDATYRGFFGPLGVGEPFRRRGIGRGLVRAALDAMKHAGYAYAVVGAAGAEGFYQRVARVWKIPGSSPGPYPAPLRGGAG